MIDASGSMEWSAAYAQYLLRAAQQSTRTHGLYYLVLQRVSRGELSPTMLRDALSAFADRRGRVYGEKLTELSARFFAGLVQIAGGASQPPPPYDGADPYGWFQRLTEYAADVQRRTVQAYQASLDAIAAGNPDGRSPSAFVEDQTRRTNEQVRALGRLYFDLLGGIAEIGSSVEEEYLQSVLANGSAADEEGSAIELAASIGESTSAVVSVENTRSDRAVVRCMVTDVRRADGIGPSFVPAVTVDPDGLMLDPGQEGSVRLSLMLDAGIYEPGAEYVGAVHIVRHGEPRLDVPLRIRAAHAEPR